MMTSRSHPFPECLFPGTELKKERTMAKHDCPKCTFRKKYDTKPKSFLGRLWRWHANWCPGWNGYMKSLPGDERAALAKQYNLKKYLPADPEV